MTASLPEVSGFHQLCSQLAGEILTQPATNAITTAAIMALNAQQSQIDGLTAELAAYQGRTVFHCTDAVLGDVATLAAAYSAEATEGDIIRATDTGRELVLAGGTWVARTRH